MFTYSVSDCHNLRLLHISDTNELFALIDTHRAYLRVWLPWLDSVQTVTDSRNFIQSSLQQFAANISLVTAICTDEHIAGIISFNRLDCTNQIGSIGYWLAEPYTGRGLMTTSCKALVNYGLHRLDLNRITISVATENRRSRAIPERLGFVHEGTLRDAEWLYDHHVDLELYACLRREWQA